MVQYIKGFTRINGKIYGKGDGRSESTASKAAIF